MKKTDNLNAKLYSTDLLDYWANRKELIPEEKYLLEKYLVNKTKKVLEAGTGGGRISFHIEQMGFPDISAFDFVPEMINHAQETANITGSKIKFEVLDASSMTIYEDNTFDYLIYLQQVLCMIEKEDLFLDSLREAYRVAKKDSILIISFLDFDSRFFNPILSTVINIIRKFRKEKISKQHLPWLKIKNSYNLKLLNKNQALTYWVKKNQIINKLQGVGFSIIEAFNGIEIDKTKKNGTGMLYIVCKK